MSQSSKKDYSSSCHNNCRIHHNPNFFNYYQYPAFHHYGCATPPLGQYSMPPQQASPPLFAQYHYTPIIQNPVVNGPQPNQGYSLEQPYQYLPNNVRPNFNNYPYNASINNHFPPQPYDEDYSLLRYNSRPPLGTEQYYNDFRYPTPPLSAEDEYNWAIHISEILDEFIGRNRSRPKSNNYEYQKLKQTLDTSLRHLQEAEALNQALVKNWEQNDQKEANNTLENPTVAKNNSEVDSVNSNNTNNLSQNKDDVPKLQPSSEQIKTLNEHHISPITVVSTSQDTPPLSENKGADKFDFLDFENDVNDTTVDDNHSVFFNDEFMAPNGLEQPVSEGKNDNVDSIIAADIHDFVGANAPNFDLMDSNVEIIEPDVSDDEINFVDIDKVKNTRPFSGTYRDYTIKTAFGKMKASDMYPTIFDQYGHLKMDHFEAMAQFGITEKQYDQLIDNFYLAKGNKNKKIRQSELGIVVKSKFNAKAFWITMIIFGIILLLIGITVALYFTVPSVTTWIDMVFDKIKKSFNLE